MSSEHKKPFFALVVITVACCVFMGYTVRAHGLGGMLPGERSPAAFVAQALHIHADQSSGGDGGGSANSGDSRALETPDVPPEVDATAEPVARPGFGKAAKTTRAERLSKRVAVRGSRSVRAAQRAAAYRRNIHEQQRAEMARRANEGSHGRGHGRGHGRDHAPGQQRKAENHRQHDNRSNHGNRHQDNRSNHGNRDHQRGYEKHQSSNRGNRGNNGNHGRR